MTRLIALVAGGLLAAASTVTHARPYYLIPGGAADAGTSGALSQVGVVTTTVSAPRAPHEIVGFGVSELRRFLETEPVRDPARIEAFLTQTIAPHFDFSTMARWAAGPFYRRLTPGHREQFHGKIRRMFLEAFARNLGSFAAAVPPVRIFPPLSSRWGDEMTVRARVFPPGTYPVTIDFRFFKRADEWRVFDVAANGFSAVSFYRRHFAAMVRAGGPAALYQ